uniref:Uncharacterized protein n=1 Tax=Hyaloperonospora arabidopsidis (strain Emoy2) TaxID=559515 RepID=M4BZ95_HYAAE
MWTPAVAETTTRSVSSSVALVKRGPGICAWMTRTATAKQMATSLAIRAVNGFKTRTQFSAGLRVSLILVTHFPCPTHHCGKVWTAT